MVSADKRNRSQDNDLSGRKILKWVLGPKESTNKTRETSTGNKAATQSVATDGSAENSDSRKFKMRPPKMSSFTADAPKAAEFQVIL